MPHIALVTGSAKGIGAAIVRELAARGDAVAIADIDAEQGGALAAELGRAGRASTFVRLDVTRRADWEAARDSVAAALGPIDILVNNAGMFRDKSLLKMQDADWDAVLEVNLKGAWIGMQTLFPSMKQNKWGRILNIASSAYRGSFGQSNYSAAKGGLVSLTKTVAMEGLKSGILVNAIAPHNVNTGILQAVPEAIRKEWLAKSRFGRFMEPEEVAAVAEFFVSDRNRVVTGQLLEVDAGELVGVS